MRRARVEFPLLLTFTVFLPFSCAKERTKRGLMGTAKMDGRFAAKMATSLSLAIVTLAGLSGTAAAQYSQYYPPGYYPPSPSAPPPGYRPQAPQEADDDEDAAAPPSGSYGRPSGAYDAPRPPAGIQSEALPPPAPPPGHSDSPPPSRGYTYGNWEPVRPPGAVNGSGSTLSPGPGMNPEYAARPPMEITPPNPGSAPASGAYPAAPGAGYSPAPTPPAPIGSAPASSYAALGPDYQPETGQPKELPPQFRRQMVDYPTAEPTGTLVIDTPNTYLYLVLGGGKAMRYGIGVGREGFTWAGREKITRMSEWPDWHPPKEMIDRQPYLPRFMAGGESNPLGARALYLGSTIYRIHGTNQPSTIGSFVSSGCIRLTNVDIEDLYSRVTVGTKVVVLPGGSGRRSAAAATTPSTR
jgi:lipoprotein-anchoring transpeptidase ErfK/SrfK